MITGVHLNAEDLKRVEGEVRRMVGELRARPTQEKEDALGLQISLMPAAEREHVTTVLLRMLSENPPGATGAPRRLR